MLVLADWVAQVRGEDPAESIRGLYDSPATCQQLTGFVRDPVAAVERCLATIGGLPRAVIARPGDVAVIDRRDEPPSRLAAGAIFLGDAWGCKGQHGVTTLHPALVVPRATWSVGYEA